jgi:hypothetical protein
MKSFAFRLALFVTLIGATVLHAKPRKKTQPVEEGDVLGSLVGTDIGMPEDVRVTGSLKRDAVQRVIDAHIAEVNRCSEHARGKVTLQFTIGAAGKVASVVPQRSNSDDLAVEQCLTRTIAVWSFPQPPNASNVSVSYVVWPAPQRDK